MTTAAVEEIPTAFASMIYRDGQDALARSHIYTKMQWLDGADRYATFPVPSAPKNVFWLQLRITCSSRSPKPLSVDLRYSPTERSTSATHYLPSPVDDRTMPVHYICTPLQVENRTWSLLTWAIPAVPMIDQQLEVCVTLPDRTAESRPEFLRLDLLGFQDLYPPSKELGLGANKKGDAIVGYYNSLRPDDCIFLPLSGQIISEGLFILPPLRSYLAADARDEEGEL
jgi:hypothetical protein